MRGATAILERLGRAGAERKESSKCAMDSTDKVIQPIRKQCQTITPTLTMQPENSTASLMLGNPVHSSILLLTTTSVFLTDPAGAS